MKRKHLIEIFLINFFLILLVLDSSAQNNIDRALANADTSNFSVNKQDGWQIYNSYVSAVGKDSMQLEAIIQHDAKLDWKNSMYIGKIKSGSLKPQTAKLAQFSLINTVFEVAVKTDGACYLRLISGNLPPGDPIVIPVKILFKMR